MYIKKIYTGVTHSKSKEIRSLINLLQQNFTELPEGSEVLKFDKCNGEFRRLCSVDPSKCSDAIERLANLTDAAVSQFLEVNTDFRPEHTEKVIFHIRGGDAVKRNPNIIVESLHEKIYLLKILTELSGLKGLIITEKRSDMTIVNETILKLVEDLGLEANLEYVVGGNPVKWWIEMTRAKYLVLSSSSYSMSASVVRLTKPTFSVSSCLVFPCFPCYIDLEGIFQFPPKAGGLFYNDGYGVDHCGSWGSSTFDAFVSTNELV